MTADQLKLATKHSLVKKKEISHIHMIFTDTFIVKKLMVVSVPSSWTALQELFTMLKRENVLMNGHLNEKLFNQDKSNQILLPKFVN